MAGEVAVPLLAFAISAGVFADPAGTPDEDSELTGSVDVFATRAANFSPRVVESWTFVANPDACHGCKSAVDG